jgi:hypothetical protein
MTSRRRWRTRRRVTTRSSFRSSSPPVSYRPAPQRWRASVEPRVCRAGQMDAQDFRSWRRRETWKRRWLRWRAAEESPALDAEDLGTARVPERLERPIARGKPKPGRPLGADIGGDAPEGLIDAQRLTATRADRVGGRRALHPVNVARRRFCRNRGSSARLEGGLRMRAGLRSERRRACQPTGKPPGGRHCGPITTGIACSAPLAD